MSEPTASPRNEQRELVGGWAGPAPKGRILLTDDYAFSDEASPEEILEQLAATVEHFKQLASQGFDVGRQLARARALHARIAAGDSVVEEQAKAEERELQREWRRRLKETSYALDCGDVRLPLERASAHRAGAAAAGRHRSRRARPAPVRARGSRRGGSRRGGSRAGPSSDDGLSDGSEPPGLARARSAEGAR